MLGITTCHIIQFPSGRFGYVGSVPAALCRIEDASKADVMGGRAYRDESGALKVLKPIVHETREAAERLAADRGVIIA